MVIISFILMTLVFDLGVMLLGEVRFWSLLGVKGLTSLPKNTTKCSTCLLKAQRTFLKNFRNLNRYGTIKIIVYIPQQLFLWT